MKKFKLMDSPISLKMEGRVFKFSYLKIRSNIISMLYFIITSYLRMLIHVVHIGKARGAIPKDFYSVEEADIFRAK